MRAIVYLLVLAGLAQPAAATAQRLNGRVIDAATRAPIAAATVRLVSGDREVASAISDPDGRFILTAPAGRYRVLGTRLGYADAESHTIELQSEVTLTAELAMSVEPVKVAPLTISVVRDRYLEARGFYDRLEAGIGDFRTADQIRRRNAQTLVDMLRGMRGLKIARVNWKNEIYFASADCLPQIAVDGVIVRYGGRRANPNQALTIEDLVNVAHVQGIEVYRGGSGVPVEFEGPNAACGVIVLWTRVR